MMNESMMKLQELFFFKYQFARTYLMEKMHARVLFNTFRGLT